MEKIQAGTAGGQAVAQFQVPTSNPKSAVAILAKSATGHTHLATEDPVDANRVNGDDGQDKNAAVEQELQ
jgi:hypothetical protein